MVVVVVGKKVREEETEEEEAGHGGEGGRGGVMVAKVEGNFVDGRRLDRKFDLSKSKEMVERYKVAGMQKAPDEIFMFVSQLHPMTLANRSYDV